MPHIKDSTKTPRKGSSRIIIKVEEEIAERHAMPVELFTTKRDLVMFLQVLAFNDSCQQVTISKTT